MPEKCSYCGETGHSIQSCPKWKGKASGRPVMVEEMARALTGMQILAPKTVTEGTAVFEAAMYSAKTSMKEPSQRRVFIQDFAATLNRHGLLPNDLVDAFCKHGYVYMEAI